MAGPELSGISGGHCIVTNLVMGHANDSDGDEQNRPDEVDEQLQKGDICAQKVGEKHRRHDDGEPDERSHGQKVVSGGAHEEDVAFALTAESTHQETREDEHGLEDLEDADGGSEEHRVEGEPAHDDDDDDEFSSVPRWTEKANEGTPRLEIESSFPSKCWMEKSELTFVQ